MDNLRIYLSTWNVATNAPSQDLNSLLDFPTIEKKNRPLPDIYVLGFQEVKSQPQNMVMDAIFSDPWTSSIEKVLKNNYVRVKSIRLQGLLLLIFCLRKHLVNLRDIEAQYTKTGLGGMWGNKGAVSIRFGIYGCSICIVNAHLTPHDHLLEDRVDDYNNIIKSNTFHVRDTANIMYHDYVFWLGDLNFRLTEAAPESPQEISEKVKTDYSSFMEFDQLTMVRTNGEAFSELNETPPSFPPTYKFEIGTSEYDTKRRPAWTDRILFKVVADNYENVTLKAEQLNYHSLPQYTLSDHKPVVSEFNIKIRMKETVVTTYGPAISFDTSSAPTSSVIPEETIVFSHYTERCVEFATINDVWYIGDADFIARYTLSRDVHVFPNDWIAVYEADFTSLDDYITYEYAGKVGSMIPQGVETSRTVVFSFPVGSGVRSPGMYRFLYFSQPCSEVRSLLGISDTFEVRTKEVEAGSVIDRPAGFTDMSSQASSSSGQESGTMDSLLKDLSKLHVPGKFSAVFRIFGALAMILFWGPSTYGYRGPLKFGIPHVLPKNGTG